MDDLDREVKEAVKCFWVTREMQNDRQGKTTGVRDAGSRSSVTGGAQLDGFIQLVRRLLIEAGLKGADIHTNDPVLPGYFRPTKEWDIVIVCEGRLLGGIEFKSHIGPSFGNNFNNRIEEALGSSTDFWAAYREGAYRPSAKPWLGYLMLLEDHQKSNSTVSVKEPYFKVFPDFHDTSYAMRYQMFCQRLMRERLYDAACFLMSNRQSGMQGIYREPSEELGFRNFANSLIGRAVAFAKGL